MSETIDKRIVEMAFENDKFEKGTAQSMSSIDRLKRALNFKDQEKSFDGISNAAGRVNLGSIADGVSHISSRFSALGVVAIATLVNMTNAAINAGTQMIKALTIDPIKAGLGEYETKLNSVQTILANTQKEGTNLEQVTEALNQLNTYSDKTIYNFQQMARNVGTFTAAGVKLDTSVAAIKGIANLAAISGSNAEQASTAMYQLSQALSSGTIRLMDWNSVVSAGMGGTVFQDAIVETARVHGVAIDQILKDEGGFRSSLQKGWLTTEIMTETLQKFTGDLNAEQLKSMGYTDQQIEGIIKLGQTATDAAQKVKTFSQLWGTLQEAAQSGWAQTWEIIIGNFDEAKSFLTDLNNWLGGILQASANARNAVLQGWKDLGGRTKLIEAFQNALNAIVKLVNPIKEAFSAIFPPTTANQLFELTKGLSAFTEKLILGSKAAEIVKRIFTGVFAFVDILRMGVVAFVKQLGILIGSFSDTGAGLAELLAKFGDWLVGLRDAIKGADTFNIIFGNIAKVIKPVIEGIVGFFAALNGGFDKTEKMTKSQSLARFLDEVGEKFKAFGKLGAIISKVFGILSRLAEKLGPIVGKIASKLGDIINHMLDAITKGLDNLDVNKVLDTLNKGLFGGILISINSFINTSKKVVGGGLFATILLSIKDFIDNGGSIFKNVAGILDSVKGSLDAYQKTLKANTLLKIAGAIGLLALSIIALTLVDQTKLVNATAVIGAMFVGLATTLDVFDKTTGGGKKMLTMTASLLGISAALVLMAGTIVILSKLDPKATAQGLIAVGSVLGLLLLFQKSATGGTGLTALSISLDAIAISMMVLSVAINKLGGSDTQTLIKGLLAMGAALAIIGVATNSMTASMAGSASLLVAAASIVVLSMALKTLGSMSLEQVGISLLALAGAFTVLGVAGALMTPIAPTLAIIGISLLAIGAAAAAFGIGIGAIGIGLGTLAVGIVTLAGLSGAGIAALTLVITGLAALIPMLAVQIVKGMTAFLTEIAKSAPKIATAFAKIGLEMLKSFATITPQVVVTVLNLILQLQKALLTKLPEIVKTGYAVLLGFLKGIRDNVGQVASVSIDIINGYLQAVASKIPAIVDSGWNLIISWIDGMKQGVEDHLPDLIDSVTELGWAIINGLLKGLIEGNKNVRDGIINLAKTVINSFKEFLGIHSPSSVFTQLAAYIIEGLKIGLITNARIAVAEIVKLGTQIVDALKGKYGSMVSAGKDLVTGFANGIRSLISTAVDKAAELARAVLQKIKDVLGIHSPSDETFEAGMFIDKGLALGITKFAGVVLNSVKDLGQKTLSGFSNAISGISDAINSDMSFSPTIRPVVDLTDIKAGGSQIDTILGGKNLTVSMANVTASNISATGKSVTDLASSDLAKKQPSQISFTQNNYSPKELSRIDIYRQTKNQLLQAKGLAGVS